VKFSDPTGTKGFLAGSNFNPGSRPTPANERLPEQILCRNRLVAEV
jgi:hypothetical protein